MGETVSKTCGIKRLDILQDVFAKQFGWDRSIMETLSEEEIKKGKSIPVDLYGGLKKVVLDDGTIVNPKDLQVVMKVKKSNLTDERGRKATWSDFAIVRAPDGTLSLEADLHNFDSSDKEVFVTDKLIEDIKEKYFKHAVDLHIDQIPGVIAQDFHDEDDTWAIKEVEIPEEVITSGLIIENNFI